MSEWRRVFRSEQGKDELDAEIAAHLALSAADKHERGASDEAARQQAQREFGNIALVKDVTRQAWGWAWAERLLQDLKYALRQLRKSPGFAAAVIGTLALGIAATAAMFTVADRVLLQPLPYEHADRLMQMQEGMIGGGMGEVPYLDLAAWREQLHSFDSIAYSESVNGRSFLQGNGSATEVGFTQLSGNMFRTLGVAPAMGAGLPDVAESFAKSASDNDVVLSDAAWRMIFGADRNILGKTIRINEQPYTVVGVMPRGFFFPERSTNPQVWGAISLGVRDRVRSGEYGYSVVGRLRPGVRVASALAELKAVQARVAQQGYTDPEWRKAAMQVEIEKYSGLNLPEGAQKALLALTGASGLLWLIACMNATNLLLARASVRQREIAMRGALGASRSRLMQQLIVEGVVLSGAASLLGVCMAMVAVRLFHHALKQHLPFEVPVWPSMSVLAALALLTIVSAIVSSAWPAFLAARQPIEPVLKQGGRQGGASRSQNRLRGGLVIAEIAMSLALLTACGLLLRTIYALRHVPLGFRTDHILVANLDIPTYRFSKINASTVLYQPLLERVQHLPGIDAAGLMTQVPLGHTFRIQLGLYEKSDKPGQQSTTFTSQFKGVSPDMQRVFGFRMLRGRYFNAEDTASAEPVLVVNRAYARAFTPEEQDLGKFIGKEVLALSAKEKVGKPAKIIGILDDFHQSEVGAPSAPEIEVSLQQLTPDSGFYTTIEGIAMDLAVRTSRSPSVVIPELRAALKQASPELANSNITTMDQIVEDSFGSQMLAARLLEIFAGSALLLCVAGLYGLLAYVVSQRTREMGVRFALGARRGDVVWLVMRQAGVLVFSGIVIGATLAYGAGRLVRSYLYGVSAHDGWTLAAVMFTLAIFGAFAAYLPARRASRVDPVEALRAE
jgi:predicted permease